MKSFFLLCASLVIFLGVAIRWAKTNALQPGLSNQPIKHLADKQVKNLADTIKVMTWNTSFAFGVGSEGTENYSQLSKEEYQRRFDQMLEVIRQENPDILLMQEVDFNSKRTHYHDQAMAVAEKLNYPYVAYAVSWDHPYVPYPRGFGTHFGKLNSGGAILSRFKLIDNQVLLYEKPKANPAWYNWFYLFRYSQLTTISIADKKYTLVNSHVEAFDKAARLLQIQQMVEHIKSMPDLLIVGGDYNTTPSNAAKKKDFEGYPDDDYDQDGAFDELSKISGLTNILSLEEYAQDEKSWFTFPSTGPERTLDYLFVNDNLKVLSKRVIQTTASDHLPMVVELQMPDSVSSDQ